jgi:hypothetical protein
MLAKLPLGRFVTARPLVARAMATVDVRLDDMLRHRVKPIRGFQLLSFVRPLLIGDPQSLLERSPRQAGVARHILRDEP